MCIFIFQLEHLQSCKISSPLASHSWRKFCKGFSFNSSLMNWKYPNVNWKSLKVLNLCDEVSLTNLIGLEQLVNFFQLHRKCVLITWQIWVPCWPWFFCPEDVEHDKSRSCFLCRKSCWTHRLCTPTYWTRYLHGHTFPNYSFPFWDSYQGSPHRRGHSS